MSKHEMAEIRGRYKTLKRFGGVWHIVFTIDQFNAIDFYATASTLYGIVTIVGEIKNYDNPDHPRPFTKFDNYMIDYGKLRNLKARAKALNAIPLLIVFFDDYTILWDLTEIDTDSRTSWEWVNKDGQNYGCEEELQEMTYLYESEILCKETREQTEQKMKLLS